MDTLIDPEVLKIRELQAKYAEEGYEVMVDPEPESLPFDLWGYRPDLLVRKGDEGYLIEVKNSVRRLPIDRFMDIVAEVRRHPGWGFLLVTADDVVRDEIPGEDAVLLSRDELRDRAATAIRLAESGTAKEAAFMALWATLEGVLRHVAVQISLPVERLPSSGLIRHLRSHGELSIPQYDAALEALEVRNRVAHGYRVADLDAEIRKLLALVKELLSESMERAA